MSAVAPPPREIPFNYTSADDRQAVSHLLGPELWGKLEELRARRITGRSARLLMRVFGEVLVHRRNAYLYEELLASAARRRRLFRNLQDDLAVVGTHAEGDALVLEVVAATRTLVAGFERELLEVPLASAGARTSCSTRSRSSRTPPTPPTGGCTCHSRW